MKKVIKIVTLILIASVGLSFASAQNSIKGPTPAPGGSYMACVDSADYYIKKEIWPQAEFFTLKALKTEPGNSANWLLWSNLGEIRMRLGNYDEAVDAFDVALNRAPKARAVLSNRATALIELGRDDEAISDLSKIIESDSVSQWALATRGMLLIGKGELQAAERDFNTLHRNYPKDSGALKGLARIAGLQGDADKAAGLYSEALAIEPDEESWFYLITILGNSGKLQEAGESLREAMKKYPRHGNFFLLRGWLHKLSYENDSAEIDRKLAIEYGADPKLIESYYSTAMPITKSARK